MSATSNASPDSDNGEPPARRSGLQLPSAEEGEAEQREASDSVDFSKVEMTEYQGIPMPQHVDEPAEIHVPNVVGLNVRDSDVFLLTYPKSGTHWLWRVIDMLLSGSAAYSERSFLQYFLDLLPTRFFDNMGTGSRRVISLHYPCQFLPTRLKEGGVKVVHLYRHPKAVLTSLLFHLRSSPMFPDLTVDKLEAMVLAEKTLFKNQFYYFDKLQEFERDNPKVDIFHLAYEDMKKDATGCIKKLAAYLNVEASDKLCSDIADAVSLKKQKQQEEIPGAKITIFRKGEADDWKNHLTVAQSERMDKVVADRAASCRFCRHYCPTVTTDQGHVH